MVYTSVNYILNVLVFIPNHIAFIDMVPIGVLAGLVSVANKSRNEALLRKARVFPAI